MLVTVTNVTASVYGTALTLNDLDSISGGVGPSAILATGGQRKYPLPYPFGHIGALASTATKQLPVHARDFRKGGPVSGSATLSPGEEWNQLVQMGFVTLTIATETTNNDSEDLLLEHV